MSAAELLGLLEEERSLLTEGRFDELPELMERKSRAEAALAGNGCAEESLLRRIAMLAERNAQLIKAAQSGMETALLRLQDIKSGMNQATYGQDGKRTPLSHGVSLVERKL